MSCTPNGQIVQLRRERPMKDAKIRRFDAVGVTEPEITPKQLEELRNVDVGNLTPIEALNKLYELQNKVKNRW